MREARAQIEAMGITDVAMDRVRAVGRAAGGAAPSVEALCGRCGRGKAAILPNGELALCVLSRFMPCGNVREQRLADLVGSERWRRAVEAVPSAEGDPCVPKDSPCRPAHPACLPKYPYAASPYASPYAPLPLTASDGAP